MRVHPKSQSKLREKLKRLTSRSWNVGYDKRKEVLTRVVRGWTAYFRLAEMRDFMRVTDQWLRARIRMCAWHSWKQGETRYRNLCRCGINKRMAWQWANTRKGCWRIAHSQVLSIAMSNKRLKQAGYPSLVDCYEKLHPC